jgi:hypothetical protein
VHRTVGQQNQDGGADVAALASSAPAAPAARTACEAEAPAGVEAEAAPAGAESEAGLKSGTERAVLAGAVLTEVFAEFATGLPPLFVKGTALLRAEPESTGWWCEWVVHGESPSFDVKRSRRFRYVNDISETIAMQRQVAWSSQYASDDHATDVFKVLSTSPG